jgi:hypothetical protein
MSFSASYYGCSTTPVVFYLNLVGENLTPSKQNNLINRRTKMNIKNTIKAVIGSVVVVAALGVGNAAVAGPYCITPFGTYYLGLFMPSGASCYVYTHLGTAWGYAN